MPVGWSRCIANRDVRFPFLLIVGFAVCVCVFVDAMNRISSYTRCWVSAWYRGAGVRRGNVVATFALHREITHAKKCWHRENLLAMACSHTKGVEHCDGG